MTTDEIIDLGHKAGTLFITQFGVASVTVEWLENFAALVAAAEREAIAKLIEDAPELVPLAQNDQGGCMMCGFNPKAAASYIRARGNT